MRDEFLTVAEIAEMLKMNPQTIRNMIDRGELPAVRVGARRVRVRRSDLDEFLAAGSPNRRTLEPGRELDEGSVTAWATFGAAMAETTAALAATDRSEIVAALDGLATAVQALADTLRTG